MAVGSVALLGAVIGMAAWATAGGRLDTGRLEAGAEFANSLDAPSSAEKRFQQAQARLQAAADRTDALDVGDAHSFGGNVKWLGIMSTQPVNLRLNCDALYPGQPPVENCISTAPYGNVTREFNDLDAITLPARSIDSFLCHAQSPLIIGTARNYTGMPNQRVRLGVFPHIDLDSAVLSDPGLVDPMTGLPFNGTMRIPMSSAVAEDVVQPGQMAALRLTSTRSCIGGFLTRANLVTGYGFTERQVDALFASPMTLRSGFTVLATGVDFGSVHLGYRFTGH